MDCKKVGELILKLRKEKNMTQSQLASIINVSDKAISKWERGLGCPDISLITDLSYALGVDIEKILLGDLTPNRQMGGIGNMKKVKFYICDECQNVITSTGDASISCCGRRLEERVQSKTDIEHELVLEEVEDEWYITSPHEMKKEHYLSFLAFSTSDKLWIIKQYPEWNTQARLQRLGHGKLYSYCTQHGLSYQII